MEYISKTDAIHVARYAAKTGKDVAGYIEHLPAADVVEVVHGEWDDYGSGVCCSACGISLFHQDENNNAGIEPLHFRYCPYCGAKMDGGADDGY